MTTPDAARLFDALDRTWQAAEFRRVGKWMLRRGAGGGKRVSATTSDSPVSDTEIADAEREMRAMNQPKLFMVRKSADPLDQQLDRRGYKIVDPVLIFVAPIGQVAKTQPPPLAAISCDQPLALMAHLWARGNIGPARLAVMERTTGPKTYLLGRHQNSSTGAAFVAIDKEVAMVHALEVSPDFRRSGVARTLMRRAAIWARDLGATSLSAVTTGENLPAQVLFTGLGLHVAAKYHYRLK